eukprot:COSAG03_NODE_11439_length_593_cov_0.730769_1_plen_42_part_10
MAPREVQGRRVGVIFSWSLVDRLSTMNGVLPHKVYIWGITVL